MDFSLIRDPDAEDARVALEAVVARHGLDSPSLRELARTAHRSPSTLLGRFGSKRHLHSRALGALGVHWHRALEVHPIVDDKAADMARLRVAFEELARSDDGTSAILDEVIEMERLHIARWLQRYAPMPSYRSGPRLAPVPALVIDALHAIALSLWDVRRYPDRAVARALFEAWAVMAVIGVEHLSTVVGPSAGTEQLSGAAAPLPSAEQSSGRRDRLHWREQMYDDEKETQETGQTFEEATRPPYTIIRS